MPGIAGVTDMGTSDWCLLAMLRLTMGVASGVGFVDIGDYYRDLVENMPAVERSIIFAAPFLESEPSLCWFSWRVMLLTLDSILWAAIGCGFIRSR